MESLTVLVLCGTSGDASRTGSSRAAWLRPPSERLATYRSPGAWGHTPRRGAVVIPCATYTLYIGWRAYKTFQPASPPSRGTAAALFSICLVK